MRRGHGWETAGEVMMDNYLLSLSYDKGDNSKLSVGFDDKGTY